jgi:WhiB family redox-sensing transcriptional regulator
VLKTRDSATCDPKIERAEYVVAPDQNASIQSERLREILDWGRLANCKGKMKLFFAPIAERPQARSRREEKAHSLCVICAVQTNCLEFAREHHELGYWGGENEEQRHLAGFKVAAPIGIRAHHDKRPDKPE